MTGNDFSGKPSAGSRSDIPGSAARPVGNERLRTGLPSADETLRQRLMAIRVTMRAMMKDQSIPRNGSILYSGFNVRDDEDVFERLCNWLSLRGYPGSIYLEKTNAGKYLSNVTEGYLKSCLDSDWNTHKDIGGSAVSLMGFWRELSARFAKKASGTVHLLLRPERIELLDIAYNFWQERLAHGDVDIDRFVDIHHKSAFSAKLTERIETKNASYRNQFIACLKEQKLAEASRLAGLLVRSCETLNMPGATRMLSEDLRVLGFVELPVLCGLISTNAGVERIKVYTCNGNQSIMASGNVQADFGFTQVREMASDGTILSG